MKYHQPMAIFMLFLLLNSAPYSQAIDLLSAYQTVSEQIGSTISSILPEKKTTDLVDWKETPDAHYIMIDAPGLKNEDIKIVVEGNGMLKVTGERNKEPPKKKDILHRRERYWWFYHEFEFKNNVDLDSVRAKLDDGVLTLFLEKLSPDKIRAPKVVKIVNPNGGDNLEDL